MFSKSLAASAIAAGTLVGTASAMAGAGNAFALPSTSSPSPAVTLPLAHSCGIGPHWPAYVQGRPELSSLSSGVYIWHCRDLGWRLRVAVPELPSPAVPGSAASNGGAAPAGPVGAGPSGPAVVYSGTLVTNGQFVDVESSRTDTGNAWSVGDNGHLLRFTITDGGGRDGFDFRLRCTPDVPATTATDKDRCGVTPMTGPPDTSSTPGSVDTGAPVSTVPLDCPAPPTTGLPQPSASTSTSPAAAAFPKVPVSTSPPISPIDKIICFDLKGNGAELPTSAIHLGADEVAPGSDPFMIRSIPADLTTSPVPPVTAG